MDKMIKGTETEKSLLKAFAGESQAKNRYTFFSEIAKKEGYEQIAGIFYETALQEEMHAKRFFSYLEGGMLEITAAYPAGALLDTQANLMEAADGEHDEAFNLYPTFGKIAEEEGFKTIAVAFRMIAKVEAEHEKRYRKLLSNIETGTVFEKAEAILWQCRNCGFVIESKKAPQKCPACEHPQAYFEPMKQNY